MRTNDYVRQHRESRSPVATSIRSLCFVCEWNEGRSAHLELSVRHRLRAQGSSIGVLSAGLSQGGGINWLRRRFLLSLGIPREEIEDHCSIVFAAEHAAADLILVSELQMKARLLEILPGLESKIMSVRGFARGLWPETDLRLATEADIEDAGGKSDREKLALYEELESLATAIAARLLALERVPQGSTGSHLTNASAK